MHKTMLASYEDVCFKLLSQAFPLFGIRDVGIGNEHTKWHSLDNPCQSLLEEKHQSKRGKGGIKRESKSKQDNMPMCNLCLQSLANDVKAN
jgi:hypothetical protein